MVDLFADIPRETVESTLQTIRANLDRVGLYGGHTLRRHADIQPLALKTRLTKEDIRYATSYWDREVADAVVKGIMKSFFDPGITAFRWPGISPGPSGTGSEKERNGWKRTYGKPAWCL